MPSVKVLHLIPTLSSGGAERQLVNLVTTTPGIDHVVAVIGSDTFFGPMLWLAGIRVEVLGLGGKHPILAAASKFRRLIKNERPDVINSWLYDANLSARIASMGTGVPVITSLQSPDYDPIAMAAGGWDRRKIRALKAVDKATARFCDQYFVACSQFVKDSYVDHYGLRVDRTSVIYNAIDISGLASTPEKAETLRKELQLPSDGFVFTNVGRLDRAKNQMALVKAFEESMDKLPDAFLLLVGSGPMYNDLSEYVNGKGLTERIRVLGRRSDIGTILEITDLFVFPSLLEGLPVALVEAMSKSLPCIASRIAVFDEVVEDRVTGLMVDPHSTDEIARAMEELYCNEDLRGELGRKAFNFVKSNFDVSVTSPKWEKLYYRIARR